MLSMMEGGVFHLCHVMLLEVFVSVLARVHCEGDADEKSKDLLGGSDQHEQIKKTKTKPNQSHLVEYRMSLVALPMA